MWQTKPRHGRNAWERSSHVEAQTYWSNTLPAASLLGSNSLVRVKKLELDKRSGKWTLWEIWEMSHQVRHETNPWLGGSTSCPVPKQLCVFAQKRGQRSGSASKRSRVGRHKQQTIGLLDARLMQSQVECKDFSSPAMTTTICEWNRKSFTCIFCQVPSSSPTNPCHPKGTFR